MKNIKLARDYIFIITIGVTASLLMTWITPYGSGVSPDSVSYIGGAESLLSGKGFSTYGNHFPPFYPMMLAFVAVFENNLIQASRFLNAILFGINASIVALTIYLETKRNFMTSLLATIFFLCSAQLLTVHAWAWSEPLFISLSLSSIMLLSLYFMQPNTTLLIISSLFLGFAALTRYVGIAFFPPAIVIIFLGGRDQGIWKKGRAVLTWCVLAIVPLGIWLIGNLLTKGKATDRLLTFHPIPISKYVLGYFLQFRKFIAPFSFSVETKPFILGFLVILFIVMFVFSIKERQKVIEWHRIEIVMAISCLLFIFSYFVFLFVSISFFDAETPIDERILSPVLAISIIGLFSGLLTISQMSRGPLVRYGFLFLIIISIIVKLPNAIDVAASIQDNGLGYTSKQWQESESVMFIRSLTNQTRIFSNGADVLDFITKKRVFSIPRKTNSNTMLDNNNFDDEMNSLCQNVNDNKAILVYFNNFKWRSYFPSQIEIEATCQLPVLKKFQDGTVYGKK